MLLFKHQNTLKKKLPFKICKLAKYEITQPTNCQPARETIVHAIADQNDRHFSGFFFFQMRLLAQRNQKVQIFLI